MCCTYTGAKRGKKPNYECLKKCGEQVDRTLFLPESFNSLSGHETAALVSYGASARH